METDPRPDQEHFGEASLGAAQSSNPPDDPDMIDPTADPLDPPWVHEGEVETCRVARGGT